MTLAAAHSGQRMGFEIITLFINKKRETNKVFFNLIIH